MNVQDLFSLETISLDLQGTNQDEVIDEMVDLLFKGDIIYDKEEFKQRILEREALSTTAFGYGIAIPHGKSATVKKPAVAYGCCKAGVDYGAESGEKTHYIFMIAVGDDDSNLHLQALAQLSRKIVHKDFRDALIACAIPEEVLEVIKTV